LFEHPAVIALHHPLVFLIRPSLDSGDLAGFDCCGRLPRQSRRGYPVTTVERQDRPIQQLIDRRTTFDGPTRPPTPLPPQITRRHDMPGAKLPAESKGQR
jgi:hypothetical protein